MNQLPKELADGVIGSVKDYLARNVGPLVLRVAALEERAPQQGEPGKDADAQAIAKEVLEQVTKVLEAIPAPKDGINGADGKDGTSVDPEQVKAWIDAKVAEIPVPQNGKDGTDGTNGKDADPEFIRSEVAKAVSELPRPQDGRDGVDGKDADPDAIFKDVMARVTKALDEIPVPKDGRDGLQGEPGRDAIAIEVLDLIDANKRYQRGTYAHHKGGLVRSFRATDPMDGELEKCGWHVVVNGIASEEEHEHEDGRIVERVTHYTDGKSFVRRSVRGVLLDRGIYKQGDAYSKGDVTTWDGSMWIAQKATDDKPGTSDAWRLSVKRGRDGRDGLRGEKGERGAEGRAGKDMTQMGFDGKKY